jgi:predicted XRE-type DNA-binding protein
MSRVGKIKARTSSGNVFRDLALRDAEGLALKAEIAMQVARLIEARRLTQTEAARLLGIGQPKISALMNGRMSGFSVERLLKCLTKLGRDVTIQDKKRRGGAMEGHIQFIAAE